MTRWLPLPACDAVVAEWAVDDVVACLGVDGIVAGDRELNNLQF
jgi:hypothetical protein